VTKCGEGKERKAVEGFLWEREKKTCTMEALSSRLWWLSRCLEEDMPEATQTFKHFHLRTFGRRPQNPEGFFRDHSLSPQETVDYLLFAACNVQDMDEHAYRVFYWTGMVLTCLNPKEGRKLLHAMERGGFVFSKNAATASKRMREAGRTASLWERLHHQAEQLCTGLSQPREKTIAGVFNNLVAECSLPVRTMETATMSDLRRLVHHYYSKPTYKRDLNRYMETKVGGNRARSIKVNRDSETVSVMLHDVHGEAGSTGKPPFSTRRACIEFLLDCAETLFLAGAKRELWEMYAHRYSLALRRASSGTTEKKVIVTSASVPEVSESSSSKSHPINFRLGSGSIGSDV